MRAPDGTYVVRLTLPPGFVPAEALRVVADLAEKYGDGRVHLTVRQTIEIPGVHPDRLEDLLEELRERGLEPGSTGPRVRQVTCCPGADTCPNALARTVPLARRLHEEFVDVWVPAKVKIAVSGCPRGCTRPEDNDVGVIGLGEGRWRVLAGGVDLGDYEGEDEVVEVIEDVLAWYSSNAPLGTRLKRFAAERAERLQEAVGVD